MKHVCELTFTIAVDGGFILMGRTVTLPFVPRPRRVLVFGNDSIEYPIELVSYNIDKERFEVLLEHAELHHYQGTKEKIEKLIGSGWECRGEGDERITLEMMKFNEHGQLANYCDLGEEG